MYLLATPWATPEPKSRKCAILRCSSRKAMIFSRKVQVFIRKIIFYCIPKNPQNLAHRSKRENFLRLGPWATLVDQICNLRFLFKISWNIQHQARVIDSHYLEAMNPKNRFALHRWVSKILCCKHPHVSQNSSVWPCTWARFSTWMISVNNRHTHL